MQWGRSVLKQKMYWFLALVWMCSLPASAKISDGDRIFHKIRPFLFQVKTSKDKNSPKASYGSGFLIRKDGIIVTNFHVISDVVNDEDDLMQLFAIQGDDVYPASVLAFSTTYDVALIKIEKTFSNCLNIRKSDPHSGESIFSLGLPKDLNMSIVEGKYNGLVERGVYRRNQMSTPINAGMSGGPTVDLNGEVVGVNVSGLMYANNLTFSVPRNHILDLMLEYDTNKKPFDKKDKNVYITKQLLSVQNSLKDDLLKDIKINEKQMGKWIIPIGPPKIQCWGNNESVDKGKMFVETQGCFLDFSSYLSSQTSGGTYELKFMNYVNKKKRSTSFVETLDGEFSTLGFSRGFFFGQIDTQYTKYSCGENFVTNKNGIRMKVVYCLTAYKDFAGLYSYHIKAISNNDTKDVIVFWARLDGFTKDVVNEFTDKYLNSIRKVGSDAAAQN